MKISIDWLSEFVEWIETDPQKIADRLTTGTAEVEEIEVQGKLLNKCCVGKVLKIHEHPNADKLKLCDVQTSQGEKRVVCGGVNLRAGMRVAFAHIGAKVDWHGDGEIMELTKVKIRGEQSEGMICAAEELGLQEQFSEFTGNKIVDLGDGDKDVGTPLREYFGLNDTILHIDNHAITQRPDLFSHVGIARECVALGLAEWKKRPDYTTPVLPKTSLPFACHNDIPGLIPRYCACLINIDNSGETPGWMKKRLEATGWRSLNLPIDITNYVMMETGMPLHSFDAGDFKGDIRMRMSKKGEKITTLDKQERKLNGGDIVISDDEGIFDLLGVMGGLRSSTKKTTRRIYLHSAQLDPVSVRKTIISAGLRTEAGTIYEKGVQAITVEQGFYRALQLILELVPGAKAISKMESWGGTDKKSPIRLPMDRLRRHIGIEIDQARAAEILTSLECIVDEDDSTLIVTPPSFRKDLNETCDLTEEVARIYGYNNIPDLLPEASIKPPARDHRIHQMRDALKVQGYFEVAPLCLTSPNEFKRCNLDLKDSVEIQNSFGVDLSCLHGNALMGLLKHAQDQLRSTENDLKTFQVANVFTKEKEWRECALLLAKKKVTGMKEKPFINLKQQLTHALNAINLLPDLKASKNIPPFAHPGQCADIIVSGKICGQIFLLHPEVSSNYDLSPETATVLLNIDDLFANASAARGVQALPLYPAVSYDETITFSSDRSATEYISKKLKSSELLESVKVTDLYQKDLKDKEYQFTLRYTYRSLRKTLTEEEVQKEHERVMKDM